MNDLPLKVEWVATPTQSLSSGSLVVVDIGVNPTGAVKKLTVLSTIL